MTDWTAGYVADVGYTYGYYSELNPHRIKLAFINQGLIFPKVGNACELGFGQGISANIHSVASTSHWCGTDFNPSQAAFAQELAAVSNSGARFYDEAFAEFCARTELPDFDYICLHGIWSWISDNNRSVIVDFIRRKLKVGGVVYISYNTQPGWAAMVPMRDLLTEHAQVMGSDGSGIVQRINSSLEFADKLIATNPSYVRANPHIGERLKQIKNHNRHYVAHEYFNKDWHPMSFSRVADWLSPAKLSYACSAHYLDHVDTINLSNEQQQLIKSIPDSMFKQSVRDFMVNQQFRKDYWVKGPRLLNATERLEALRSQQVMLTQYRDGIALEVNCALGKATLQEAVYGPILELLSDYRFRSIGDIEQTLMGKVSLSRIMQAVMVLAGAGHLISVQSPEEIENTKQNCQRLNTHILQKALSNTEINYLASPVSGGGFAVNRFEQLYLIANERGIKASNWPQFVWSILSSQDQKLVKDGKTIETPEENLAELQLQVKSFVDKKLSILQSLQIV